MKTGFHPVWPIIKPEILFFYSGGIIKMMRITAITPQKKKSSRYNVFINDSYAFSLSAKVIWEKRLQMNQIVTEQELTQLQHADAIQTATDLALNKIARRPHTIHELRNKLADFPAEIVKLVIDDLIDKNYLNDFQFAQRYVQNRLNLKPRSFRAIESELKRKGVNPEVVKKAFAESEDLVDELEIALRLAKKKLPSYLRFDLLTKKNRLYQFLSRKGFDYEIIRQVFNKLNLKDDD